MRGLVHPRVRGSNLSAKSSWVFLLYQMIAQRANPLVLTLNKSCCSRTTRDLRLISYAYVPTHYCICGIVLDICCMLYCVIQYVDVYFRFITQVHIFCCIVPIRLDRQQQLTQMWQVRNQVFASFQGSQTFGALVLGMLVLYIIVNTLSNLKLNMI